MSLSVLIVNWNSKDFLRECLRSLLSECRDLRPQIVVVDGGSFDGCDQMLAAEFPGVEFVQSRENVGFGRSNNVGFARCTGTYLLLLNPDTVVRPGAVERLLEELRRRPRAGIVAPCLLNTDGTLQDSCVQALPTPWNQAIDFDALRRRFPNWRVWGAAALYRPESTEVEAVSGACMLVRSDLFRSLEGFDPRYFMYGEDMDFCWRVRRAGWGVYHLPDARVVHHGGGSSRGSFSRISAVMMRESTLRFIRTSQGGLAGVAYRVLIAVAAVGRIVALLPLWFFASSPGRRRLRDAVRKWAVILRWSIGIERLSVQPRI